VTVPHVNMVVTVILMVTIPTVVPVPVNGMVPAASILTVCPPVGALPVPIMAAAIPMVPTTSIVTVFPATPENNANILNPLRVPPNRVKMGVRVLIAVHIIRVCVKSVTMVSIVSYK